MHLPVLVTHEHYVHSFIHQKHAFQSAEEVRCSRHSMAALQPALSWELLHHEHGVSGSDGLWRTVQIFVEYVMLHKVNDSPETAHELGELLHGRNMIVNLIPWNPIYSPGMKLQAPGAERVAEFQRIVSEEHGIFCTVRQEMGQDISGEAALPSPALLALCISMDRTCMLRSCGSLGCLLREESAVSALPSFE